VVLPLADRNPTHRRPFVNWVLVAANIAVFVGLMLPLDDCELAQFVYLWSALPVEILTFQPVDPGAIPDQDFARCIAPVVADKLIPVSAFTAMFLHGGLLHLGFNMLFLWIFGNNVEDRLGHLRYLAFYVAGGLFATYAFAVVYADHAVPLLGASGAVAAVLGAYLLLHPRARVHTYVPFPLYLLTFVIPRARITGFFLIFAIMDLPAWAVLSIWFALQLAGLDGSADEGVAFEAHVAGFLFGLVFIMIRKARSGNGDRTPQARR
jgi:membrane associated rhomboid family serine protease